tara:strand:+ start:1161 stop:1994 length:834 start_codon:yes stop_codon:yes gene_type:complete
MYCISIDQSDLKLIQKLNYFPVGLGEENFTAEWHRDNTGKNISYKNKWYSELTFHYWLWKNKIIFKNDNNWEGFCAYRDFWANENQYEIYLKNKKNFDQINVNDYKNIENIVIKDVPNIWSDYDVILGQEIFLYNLKFSKFLKYGKLALLKNPKAIFKKGRTIKFHFDMFHGKHYLDKAIENLEESEKNDFFNFVTSEVSFNRGCMFVCKSKKIMENFYNSLFPWLEKCEKDFGFEDKGYENRIYAFLAERYMSYWFKKYSNYLVWPIISFNIPRKS